MHAGKPSLAAAEHTWALILVSMRQIPQQMESLRSGDWQMGVGKTLHGRTLGLYGYGRIAHAVANYAVSFGMDVVWWASAEGRERAMREGHTVAANRQDFFRIPEVVSVHVRLTPSTNGIITAADFAAMRKDALFVNTSRAVLIEADALLNALNAGRAGSAAIDVFDQEPISWPDDPLATHPRLIGMPHIGFVTEDEFEIQFSDIFDQVIAFDAGAPTHMINPEVIS